jgi:protein-L-isoaspartate(D-aspartate) O-methyltransferase
MVENQLRCRGISDERVLQIMNSLPRERFIPENSRDLAYLDQPVAIGNGQTISQPYIVALMTEKLQIQPHHLVLEIGTGCGYQTAILAQLARKVYTVELINELAQLGRKNVMDAGISNVEYHIGDGCLGWSVKMQFDRILIAAVAEEVPPALFEQLAEDGKMVIPVGYGENQRLLLFEKQAQQIQETTLCYCRFVKLIHKEK